MTMSMFNLCAGFAVPARERYPGMSAGFKVFGNSQTFRIMPSASARGPSGNRASSPDDG
jgi:hypothetical protein